MTRDGLERLRRWRDGARGVPPAVGRLGVQLIAVERGTTTMRLPLSRELLVAGRDPSGAVPAMLCDFGLTSSVVASLPDLRGVTTISLTVDHHRLPPTTGALVVTCQAQPFDAAAEDEAPQHCAGQVRDEDGALVATTSGWFLATAAPAAERDRQGVVTEPPATDLHALLDVPAAASFTVHARDALSNALGTLHGGIGALASVLAAQHLLPDGMQPLTTSSAFLRPTPRHGNVQVRGELVRAGRRTATAAATIRDDAGRLLVQTTVVAARR